MTWGEVASLATVVVAAGVAVWGYKRGSKSDAVAEKSAVAAETRLGTQQLIDGLKILADQWREAWEVSREGTAYLQERLDEALAALAAATVDVTECRAENARLRKHYGDNGAKLPEPPPSAG